MSLTEKQELFVSAYCGEALFNGTEAARRAKYAGNDNTLAVVAYENLRKPAIRDAIQKRMEQIVRTGHIQIRSSLFSALIDHCGTAEAAVQVIETIIRSLIEDADARQEVMKKMRSPVSNSSRYNILLRAGFKCQACGAKPLPHNDVVLHIDHIVPVSWGGSDEPDNLQVLCQSCNTSKSDRYAFDHNIDQGLEDP